MTTRHKVLVPDDWDTVKNPRSTIRERSYSYYYYSQVSSATQKSVRRSLWPESAFWMLDAFRTGPQCATNIRRRMFIFCVEDIGIANPCLLLHIDSLLRSDNPIDLLRAMYHIARSPKDRTLDWMICSLQETYEQTTEKECLAQLTNTIHELHTSLSHKKFVQSARLVTKITSLAQANPDYRVPRELCKRWKTAFKSIAKIYPSLSGTVWIPMMGFLASMSGPSRDLLVALYTIGSERSGKFQFRGKGGELVLFMYLATYTICYPDRIVPRELGSIDDSVLEDLSTRHLKRTFHYDMPDYAVDKHTLPMPGMKRRGYDHFILHGSILCGIPRDSVDRQKHYLEKVVARWIKEGKLARDFVLPSNYFTAMITR